MIQEIKTHHVINDQQLIGFFEGDGHLKFGVTLGEPGVIYITLSAVFSQHERNRPILEIVKTKFNNIGKISFSKNQGQYEVNLGEKSIAGKMLLEILAKNQPVNPGNYLDYLICLITIKAKKTKKLPLSGALLDQFNAKTVLEQKRLVMLVLLWLRFQRSGASFKREKLKSIQDYYDDCLATVDEISETVLYGAEVMKPILKNLDELIKRLDTNQIYVSKDYLSFYHVADGCLKVEVQRLEKKTPVILLVPCWQISDDRLSNSLLECIKRQYQMSTLSRSTKEKVIHLRANGWDQLEKVVIPFFNDVALPTNELLIFKKIERLFELDRNPFLKRDYSLYFEYVSIAYFLNVKNHELGDNSKRSVEEFERDYVPFIKRAFISMNPTQVIE